MLESRNSEDWRLGHIGNHDDVWLFYDYTAGGSIVVSIVLAVCQMDPLTERCFGVKTLELRTSLLN